MLLDTKNPSSFNNADCTSEIIVTQTSDRLSAIANPATSLAIWEREISPDAYHWLRQLEPDQLPRGRVHTKCENIDSAIDSFFEMCQLKVDEAANLIAKDIASLANLYADIAKIDRVDVRLDAIQHDACWRFHLDQVSLRLVTTYVGEGTQYVSPSFAEQALSEQKAYSGPLEKIAEQAVALFKGARSGQGNGIVHRSPPASSSSRARLLLCINAPSEASPELWKPAS